jgi:hypothetical protein
MSTLCDSALFTQGMAYGKPLLTNGIQKIQQWAASACSAMNF